MIDPNAYAELVDKVESLSKENESLRQMNTNLRKAIERQVLDDMKKGLPEPDGSVVVIPPGLELHPNPGMLRAVVCTDGKAHPPMFADEGNPMLSELSAELFRKRVDEEERQACGPHRICLYQITQVF